MKKVKVYKTVSGDTWDLISYKLYGSEQYFHQLMRANPTTSAVETSKLPPWKR